MREKLFYYKNALEMTFSIKNAMGIMFTIKMREK